MNTSGEAWTSVPCDIRPTRRATKQWRRILGDPGDKWFLHRCGRSTCWEPLHIYLGTAKDNTADMLRDNPDYIANMAEGVRRSYKNGRTPLLHLPGVAAKVAAKLKGRPRSEETKAKIAASLRGNQNARKNVP